MKNAPSSDDRIDHFIAVVDSVSYFAAIPVQREKVIAKDKDSAPEV